MRIKNLPGLSIDFLDNGSIRSIEADPIRISLKATTHYSNSGANIYLRKRDKPLEFTPLLGPDSNSGFEFGEDLFMAKGNWKGLDYKCILQLSKKDLSWQWDIAITNTSADFVELDLIYLQDAGLKALTDGLINEYYVSQYLERRILEDATYGSVICCRQNMKESVGNPWLMLACRNKAISASVDGMQFYGNAYRETGIPEGLLSDTLGGEYSGESAVLALQEKPFKLAPGETHHSLFFALYLHDHPQATSESDLDRLRAGMESRSTGTPSLLRGTPSLNLFNASRFFPSDDLSENELVRFFGEERRHPETFEGNLLSFFFKENNHVVLRTKETMVDRPHAHIMQANAGFAADENIVSTTSFACGVFNSHLSQGNTNFNILLSVCTSQFNLDQETGQRILVEIEGRNYLLGVPSAFEMGLNHCRWIYKHGDYCFQVRTWTSPSSPRVSTDFKVLSGHKLRLLITHDFDPLNGWSILPGKSNSEFVARPLPMSMIATKFPDAQFRILINSADCDYKPSGAEVLFSDKKNHGKSLFVLDLPETSGFCMSYIGEVRSAVTLKKIDNADDQWASDCRDAQSSWQALSLNLAIAGDQEDMAAIREILPWYGMNALTHFLTPYGLEQFSGAAWGTRDVCQGPLDLLLCMEKYNEARQVLKIIFSNQNPDGGWPQWWMFDSYSHIRADSAHGDVVYWCIIALSNYIKVTGDLKILEEVLPYYLENKAANPEKKPLSEHIDRLIRLIVNSFIPGTSLVPFDGGDWNDSLQPVNKELAQRMISSWTVEMNYQAFSQYQAVYNLSGETKKAEELKEICEKIKADFNKYLVKDDVVAGYGLMEKDGSVSLLLHPTDTQTGVRYSILPMERGMISEIFTKKQAKYHQELIEKYLKGPDGARLMDRPLKYKGGIQTIFQRAESSTFFGREIGLMYVHEHIRYAETLALTGEAEAFVKALRQAIPVRYRDIVPCGDFRQSNCYYSSSDVAFKNRYEADEGYNEIKSGKIMLKGGWRVYSSGPGIYIGIIVTRLFGLRVESGNVMIDPVMPYSFDGLSVSMDFMGRRVTFTYSVKEDNFGPKSVSVNGNVLNLPGAENKYRRGGVIIEAGKLLALLDLHDNVVEIKL